MAAVSREPTPTGHCPPTAVHLGHAVPGWVHQGSTVGNENARNCHGEPLQGLSQGLFQTCCDLLLLDRVATSNTTPTDAACVNVSTSTPTQPCTFKG